MKRKIFLMSSSIFCGFLALLFVVLSCEWYLGLIAFGFSGKESYVSLYKETFECIFSIFAWVPENTVTWWISFYLSYIVTSIAPILGMGYFGYKSGKLFEKYKKEISESKEISQEVSESTDLDGVKDSREISKSKETSEEFPKLTDLDGVKDSRIESHVKELLSNYKVVKHTSYQLRPKSGISPETVERALLEMKRKGGRKIWI